VRERPHSEPEPLDTFRGVSPQVGSARDQLMPPDPCAAATSLESTKRSASLPKAKANGSSTLFGKFQELPDNELPSQTTSVAIGPWSCQQGPQFEDMRCEIGLATIVATVCGTACTRPSRSPPPSTLPSPATPGAWTTGVDSTCTVGAEAVTIINDIDVLYCASTDNGSAPGTFDAL
jgi:hypothetical protein